jgi:hypothetical protein
MKITNFGGAALISGLQQRGATQRYGTVNLEVTIDARKNLVTPGVHFYIEEYNPESNRTKIISVFFTRDEWNQIKETVSQYGGEL